MVHGDLLRIGGSLSRRKELSTGSGRPSTDVSTPTYHRSVHSILGVSHPESPESLDFNVDGEDDELSNPCPVSMHSSLSAGTSHSGISVGSFFATGKQYAPRMNIFKRVVSIFKWT